MIKTRKSALLSIVVFAFVIGCREEKITPLEVKSSDLIAPQPPYPFDWETAEFMPTPSNIVIRVPWSNSVNILYDPIIRYDFKSIDGWKLIYNTFNPNTYTNGEFFALYNKYRGILRYYIYISPNNNTLTSYLEEEIVAYSPTGKSTSFFNFVGQEVVDPGNNLMKSKQMKPFPIPSEGGWYVSQYEVAYDKNLKNLTYTDLSLLQTLKFWQISNIELSGTISGTGQGTIQTPSGSFDWLFSAAGKIATSSVLLNEAFSWTENVKKSIEAVQTDGVKGVVNGIANLVTSKITGGGPQQLNFVLEATAKLNGTQTSTGNVKTNFTIAMPGTSNATNGVGPVPIDNLPLGVYNLNSLPVVSVKNSMIAPLQCLAPYGMTSSAYEYTFYLDNTFLSSLSPSSSNNVYNPEFLKVASVTQSNFYNWTGWTPPIGKLEILVGTHNTNISNGIQIVGTKDCAYLNDETIAGLKMKNITPAKNGASSRIVGNGIFRSDTPVYLRVTFDVIPKDGSPATTIIKTFKCYVSSWS